jgi:hypothetical protein
MVTSDTTSWIDPGASRPLRVWLKATLEATIAEFEEQ